MRGYQHHQLIFAIGQFVQRIGWHIVGKNTDVRSTLGDRLDDCVAERFFEADPYVWVRSEKACQIAGQKLDNRRRVGKQANVPPDAHRIVTGVARHAVYALQDRAGVFGHSLARRGQFQAPWQANEKCASDGAFKFCQALAGGGERDVGSLRCHREQNHGSGQQVDVALYESVFNMMESLMPEYSVFQSIRQPAGSSLPGIAPTNAYRCNDGKYALIAGNGDSIYRRLMEKIERPDLAADPELEQNDGRVRHVARIDAAISAWTAERSLDEVLLALNEARIPAGKIYDAADIATDPHYLARDMLLQSTLDDGTAVTLPGIVPKLQTTPGQVRSTAPTLGQHTDSVLEAHGVNAQTRAEWRSRGII